MVEENETSNETPQDNLEANVAATGSTEASSTTLWILGIIVLGVVYSMYHSKKRGGN